MGAIETSNRIVAAALVVPVVNGPFDKNLQASKGFLTFTRLGAGQYVLGLETLVSLHEVTISVLPLPNTQVQMGAQVQPNGSIFVSALSMADGTPVDVEFFTITVLLFNEGEGVGPVRAVPASPSPLTPSGLLGAMTNVYWVDQNSTSLLTPDGSLARPFTTIQAAFDAIPVNTTSLVQTWTVIAAPDDYDEALMPDITMRRIILGSFGRLGIGVFAAGGDPTTRRNITIVGSDEDATASYIGFTLTSFVNTLGQNFDAPFAGPFVSGQILNNVVHVDGFSQLEIHGTVFGDTGGYFSPSGTAYTDAGSTNDPGTGLFFTQAKFLGDVTAPSGDLLSSEDIVFAGAVTCRTYSAIRNAEFQGNFTYVNGPSGGGAFDEAPYGILQSRFATGTTIASTGLAIPFADLVVDAETNYTIVNNNVTITFAAGASKKVVASLPPMSTYRFGATFGVLDTNKIAIAAGTALDTAATVASAATGQVVERVDVLTALSWNSDTASGTTVVRLYKNAALQQTLTLTGVKGQRLLNTPLSVAIGDLLSMDYASGTAPGGLSLSLTS